MANVISAQMKGVKELRKACKQMEVDISELKDAYQKVGVLVLATAKPRIHSVTGALVGSYKASVLQTGGKIKSKLPYSGVQEFGGSVWWRSRGGGEYARVPIADGYRMMKAHRIRVKPHNTQAGVDSYYVYPAFAQKQAQIAEIYATSVEELMKKCFRTYK
jgi:hypothetical protein